jgi:hypothetical protein
MPLDLKERKDRLHYVDLFGCTDLETKQVLEVEFQFLESSRGIVFTR